MVYMRENANLTICEHETIQSLGMTHISNILRLLLKACKLFWCDDRHGG